MAYYDRYEDEKRKNGYKFREEKKDWEEEKDYDEEKDWEEEEDGDFEEYDKRKKEPKKPCFFEEKKCKFEFPFKVIVKVVPIDDHRHCKKFD